MWCYLLYENDGNLIFTHFRESRSLSWGLWKAWPPGGRTERNPSHMNTHECDNTFCTNIWKGFESDGNLLFLYLSENREACLGTYAKPSFSEARSYGPHLTWSHINVIFLLHEKDFKIMEALSFCILLKVARHILGPMESLAPWRHGWKGPITHEYIWMWCYLLCEYTEKGFQNDGSLSFCVFLRIARHVLWLMETLAPWRQGWKHPITNAYIWTWFYLLYEYTEKAFKMMETYLFACFWESRGTSCDLWKPYLPGGNAHKIPSQMNTYECYATFCTKRLSKWWKPFCFASFRKLRGMFWDLWKA